MTAAPDRNVLFDPSPKQVQFLQAVFDKIHTKILFGGAIRGGKTYAGLGALLLLCRMYPGSIWAVVRDSLPTLKRNTIPAFLKICPKNFIVSYNQEQQLVTFKNGAKILFFPENYDDDKELNRWKGLEVSGFLLEECNELQELSFWKAVERAGSYIPTNGLKKPKPLVMMTCNPANNWVKELIFSKWELDILPPGWMYIPSKITDNPYVMADTDYIDSLKQLPTYQYRVFVEGDWNIQLKIGGEYFKCFELDKHVKRDIPYDPSLSLHISWDDNVHPYLPCGIFQVHKTTILTMSGKHEDHFIIRMIDEVAGETPYNTVEEVCKEIERKYPAHDTGMYIYGDATANKEDTKLQKGHNFYTLINGYLKKYMPQGRVMAHNPNVVPRAAWMNSVMEKNVGHLTLEIAECCKKAINDFVLLKEDENGGKAKLKTKNPKTGVTYQTVGHFSDLLEYFMVSLFSKQFADYQSGGAVSSIRFGKNSPSKNSY